MVKLTSENIADIEWALERGKSADVRYMADKKIVTVTEVTREKVKRNKVPRPKSWPGRTESG